MVKLKLLVLLVVIIASSGCMEDVIRVVDTYPIQYINASNITVAGAASTVGNITNLSDINAGYYNVSESTTPFYVVVNFTNMTNFSYLEVKAKYFSVTGTPSTHVVDVEIYCTTDNEYEDVFFMENADDWRYFTRNFPDSEHFINSQSNVSIKFNHTANGNVNHRLFIDTVRLVIKETFEQNTVYLTQNFNTTGGSGASSLSQLTIDTNKSWQGYNITNMSGLGLTGKLNTTIRNGTYNSFTMFGSSSTPFFTAWENGTLRVEIAYGGLQIWKLRDTDSVGAPERGYIVYSTPGGLPGIGFFNSSLLFRSNLFEIDDGTTKKGFMINSGNASSFKATGLLVDTNDNVTIDGLKGSGNDYVCVDANGKLFRANTGC